LRKEFETIPNAHYAGARRGELTATATPTDDLFIGSDQAAQALAAFHGQPQRAYHGKSRIWEEDALYAQFFGDHVTARHIVFAVSLYHAIVEHKRALRLKTDRTADEDAIFAFLSQRGAAFLLMAAFGRCQEIILGKPVADRYGLSLGGEVSPQVGMEVWEPLVASLVSFHAALQPAAESGRIRVQEVREQAIQSFAAQVQAVKGPLSEVFAAFAAHVVTESAGASS